MSTALATLTQKLASTLNLGDGQNLVATLKTSIFKEPMTDDQLATVLTLANQYGLNPWTKEIYAFKGAGGGIVPVVGVDGWSRIINANPKFDGMEFEQTQDACTCIIYRKGCQRPVKVTEFLSECQRATTTWKSYPKRMLRHKAMIQCARLAFGYGGIYDPDEAEHIIEAESVRVAPTRPAIAAPAELPAYSDESFADNIHRWAEYINAGKKTPEQIIAMISTRYQLSEAQKLAIYDLAPPSDDASPMEMAA